jgi:hypothetical protein
MRALRTVGFLVVATAGSAFGVELEMSVLHRAALGERVESLALARLAHQTRPIELTRVELRAPGAKTSVIAGDSTTLQTSSRLLFLGHGADGTRAALALAPDGTSWALLASPELGTIEARGAGGVLTPIVSDDVGQGLSINCTGAPLAPGEEPSFFETSPRSSAALGGTPTYQAVVAIDTDNEFHHKKFANNTVAAETWIDELFLAMNVFYERDLDLRLLRGDTFFRLDLDVPPTYDNDPWTLTGSPLCSMSSGRGGRYIRARSIESLPRCSQGSLRHPTRPPASPGSTATAKRRTPVVAIRSTRSSPATSAPPWMPSWSATSSGTTPARPTPTATTPASTPALAERQAAMSAPPRVPEVVRER